MCMNSVVESVNAPFPSPGLVSPLAVADLAVWFVLAAWLSLGVIPLLGTVSTPRKLMLGVGVLAALAVMGLWSALAPVAAGVLANAPTCPLDPEGLLLLSVGAPALLLAHAVGLAAFGKGQPARVRALRLAFSTVAVVLVAGLVREAAVFPSLCVSTVVHRGDFAEADEAY